MAQIIDFACCLGANVPELELTNLLGQNLVLIYKGMSNRGLPGIVEVKPQHRGGDSSTVLRCDQVGTANSALLPLSQKSFCEQA